MNIGRITQPIVQGLLGPALGGPVAALMMPLQGGQLKQLASALQQFQGGFGKASGFSGAQTNSRPQPFSPVNINITISLNPMGALSQGPAAQGPLQSFGKVPEVGSESQWPGFANAANARITGNDKSFNMNGTNPWQGAGDKSDMAAVAWGLQKNDKVRFDSDRKQFYVTNSDGSKRDVASLDEVKAQISKAGGANQSNGAAYNAVGSFLEGRVNNPQSSPAGNQAASSANPFQQLMDMLQKLLQGMQGAAGSAASALNGGTAGGSSSTSSSSSAGGTSSAGSSSGGGKVSAGNMDSMMSKAEGLMKSDSLQDQVEGQKLMQQVMRMFEMLSKMIEKRSEMQSKAIAAIK